LKKFPLGINQGVGEGKPLKRKGFRVRTPKGGEKFLRLETG